MSPPSHPSPSLFFFLLKLNHLLLSLSTIVVYLVVRGRTGVTPHPLCKPATHTVHHTCVPGPPGVPHPPLYCFVPTVPPFLSLCDARIPVDTHPHGIVPMGRYPGLYEPRQAPLPLFPYPVTPPSGLPLVCLHFCTLFFVAFGIPRWFPPSLPSAGSSLPVFFCTPCSLVTSAPPRLAPGALSIHVQMAGHRARPAGGDASGRPCRAGGAAKLVSAGHDHGLLVLCGMRRAS